MIFCYYFLILLLMILLVLIFLERGLPDISLILFLSNISDTAGEEDVSVNATEASKSIRSKTEVTLRTLVTETQDILDNLTESVKQFFDSSK